MLPDLKSIERRRKSLGITQKQLALSAQISQSLVTKIERGLIIPNYEIAKRIFVFLDSAEKHDEKCAKDFMHEGVIMLDASDKISTAAKMAKKHHVSQFPVVDGKTIVGSIATRDILDAPRNARIGDFAAGSFPTINPDTPISIVKPLLRHHSAVLVVKNTNIEGIITAEDFLS